MITAPKLRAALFMTLVGMVTLPGCVTHERQVSIDAPAACVWQTFQEVEHFPEWNPFFTHVDGKLDVGTHPHITMQPVGKSSQGWEKMNLALKKRSEKATGTCAHSTAPPAKPAAQVAPQ